MSPGRQPRGFQLTNFAVVDGGLGSGGDKEPGSHLPQLRVRTLHIPISCYFDPLFQHNTILDTL